MSRLRANTGSWLAAIAGVVILSAAVHAQNIPPGTFPGGDQLPVDTGTGIGTGQGSQASGTQQQTTQGGQADIQSLGDFVNQFNLEPEVVEIENQRLKPFVGPSRAAFSEQGLSHPRSQIDPMAGGQPGARATGGRVGGAGAAAQPLDGFEVVRAGIRTRLVPRFEVRQPVSSAGVSSRFRQRLARIPSVNSSADGIRVSVQNRVATLSGSVATIAERERIERMARLEAGISGIDNQITVVGQ